MAVVDLLPAADDGAHDDLPAGLVDRRVALLEHRHDRAALTEGTVAAFVACRDHIGQNVLEPVELLAGDLGRQSACVQAG